MVEQVEEPLQLAEEAHTEAARPLRLQSRIPLPKPLVVRGNISQSWREFRQIWDSYEILANLKLPDMKEHRIATFITCLGQNSLRIYNALPFANDADKRDLDKVLEEMEKYCLGETNVIYERFRFNQKAQREGESFDQFLTDLKELAKTCQFGQMHDELLRDKIVVGVREDTLRKLLQKKELMLATCVSVCRACETTAAHMKEMGNNETQQVHAFRAKQKSFGKQRRQLPRAEMSTQKECKYCGKDHKWGKQHCAAYGKLCKKCNKQNQFAQMCRLSAKSGTKQAAVHMMRYDSDSMYEDSSDDQRWSKLQVVTLTLTPRDDEINVLDGRRYENKLCTTLTVDETPIRFQIDTGATCNVIRKQDIPHRRLNYLQQTTQTLTQYSGAEIRPLGKCILRVKNQKNAQTYDVQFVVVDNAATTSILGAQTSQVMSLIKVDYDNIQMIQETEQSQGRVTWRQTMLTKEVITKKYAEVFEGELGTLPGVTHLDIDPMIQPVKQPLRRLPIAMKRQIESRVAET